MSAWDLGTFMAEFAAFLMLWDTLFAVAQTSGVLEISWR